MPAGPVGRRVPLTGPVTPPQRLFSALDKDELKEKCLQKVKAERARLIAKLRRERMGMVSAAHSKSSSSSSMDLALEARSILAAGLRQHSSRASAVEEIECADDAAAAAEAEAEAHTESMQECAAEEAAYRNLHSTAVDYSKADAMQTDAQQQQQQQQQQAQQDAEQLYDDDADSTRQMLSLDEYEDMMCFIEQVRLKRSAYKQFTHF
jgi:hypothetical protein